MELMDWKNLETGALQQIRNGEMDIVIGNIMLREAEEQILKLNGKTHAQDAAGDAGTQKTAV